MMNIFLLFLLFAPALEYVIPGFNYWDELMVIAVPVWCLLRTNWKIKKSFWGDLLIPVIIVFIGILSNIVNPGIQESLVAIIKDILALLKFPIVFACLLRMNPIQNKKNLVKKSATVGKYVSVIGAISAIVGYFFNIGVYMDEVRYVKVFKFIFTHPTFMVSAFVLVIGILMADSISKNKWYILLDCLLILLGQRTKGYVMIVIALFFIFIKRSTLQRILAKLKGKGYIRKRYLIYGSVLLIALGWYIGKSKFLLYYSYGLTATRPALYIIGAKIALDFFPLGSGFGTFASSLSGEFYSNIYSRYGIAGVNGMTQLSHNYIGDTFWPYIYGQFGIIGCLLYIIWLWKMIKGTLFRVEKYNQTNGLIFVWIYALVASTAEAFFTNSTIMQFAIIVPLILTTQNQSDNSK